MSSTSVSFSSVHVTPSFSWGTDSPVRAASFTTILPFKRRRSQGTAYFFVLYVCVSFFFFLFVFFPFFVLVWLGRKLEERQRESESKYRDAKGKGEGGRKGRER